MKARWLWLLGATTAAYGAWRLSTRGPPPRSDDLFLLEATAHGEDRGQGALIAAQPWMLPVDYASEEGFAAKLTGYLEEAKRRGWLSSRAVVVLPAHIGTFLLVEGEARRVYVTRSFEEATARCVAAHLPSYLAGLFPLAEGDPFSAALFRAKAKRMAALYSHVLGGLARRYGVTIVGGSLLLPAPRIEDGVVRAGRGALREVCAVFAPDGEARAPLVGKASLEPDERGFVEPGALDEPRVFETPAGRLGVLLGRDAFQPAAYEALATSGAELVAAPAYLAGEAAWTSRWPGYLGGEAPPDVRRGDQDTLLEAEAWQRYGLGGRLRDAGARAGAAAFFRGALWDRSADGAALVVREGEALQGPLVGGGTLTCLWL